MIRRICIVMIGLTCVLGIQSAARAAAVKPAIVAPFVGDVTGDGIPDRIVLGGTAPTCVATVAKGRANGTFGQPVDHPLTLTGAPSYCPDLGAVGSFTKRGVPQLAVAWFIGAPPGLTDNLLVLQNYRQIDASAGMFMPSGIRSADFNGDGFSDIYEYADQEGGIVTYNSVKHHLVPGPVRVYSDDASPRLVLSDLNDNHDVHLLVGYFAGAHAPGGEDNAGADTASVVDTKTGVETVLAYTHAHSPYVVTPIDYNGDKRLDILVSGGGSPDQIFVNRGHERYVPVG